MRTIAAATKHKSVFTKLRIDRETRGKRFTALHQRNAQVVTNLKQFSGTCCAELPISMVQDTCM